MTDCHEQFEYQELIVGIAHRRTGPVNFRRTTTPTGLHLDVGVEGNAMALLNLEGRAGWRVLQASHVDSDLHPWVVAELQDTDRDVVSVSGAYRYLMERRVGE